MTFARITAGLGLVAATALWHGSVHAQFGLGYPQGNFTWNWGDFERRRSPHPDIDVDARDGRFSCNLTADLRVGSRWTVTDIREFENSLRTSLEFIREATNAMNILDAQRELEWATLACTEPEPEQVSEEEKLERETRARERMMREVERRRARERDDE